MEAILQNNANWTTDELNVALKSAAEAGNYRKMFSLKWKRYINWPFIGKWSIAESLLRYGANINITNQFGDTMIMLAIRQGKQSII